MSEDKSFHARESVARAGHVKSMCQTEGFKILQETLDDTIRSVSRRMIDVSTSEEQALELRREAQVWTALHKLLRTIMQTGKISALNLANLEAPSNKEG